MLKSYKNKEICTCVPITCYDKDKDIIDLDIELDKKSVRDLVDRKPRIKTDNVELYFRFNSKTEDYSIGFIKFKGEEYEICDMVAFVNFVNKIGERL